MQLSIVIPLYNEAESLPELSAWIVSVMQNRDIEYEILFVDDGSTFGRPQALMISGACPPPAPSVWKV